jgi:hypothetical protein
VASARLAKSGADTASDSNAAAAAEKCPASDASWRQTEQALREGLALAAREAGISDTRRELHGASATELEILHGALDQSKVPDADEHVFAFFRTIKNKDAIEVAFPEETAWDLVDTRYDEGQPRWDRDAWARLQRLKEELRGRIGGNSVWEYEAVWRAAKAEEGERGAGGALEIGKLSQPRSLATTLAEDIDLQSGTFCGEVWERLSRIIREEMKLLDAAGVDAVEVECAAHEEFRRRAVLWRRPNEAEIEFFWGQEGPLAAIAQYLAAVMGGPGRPLVVYGGSGSGKTAVMAQAFGTFRDGHSRAVCIQRYVGATPRAAAIRPLLESLCEQIRRTLGGDAVPKEYEKLTSDFRERLKLATAEKPLILFVDSLDQLGDNNSGRNSAWLPVELPPHVRIVVSTLPEEEYECLPKLRRSLGPADFVEICGITVEEGRQVLDVWLGDAKRKLTEVQRTEVLAKFERTGLPLYLKLAFEEARLWRSYDGVPAPGLAEDVPGLIRSLESPRKDISQRPAPPPPSACSPFADSLAPCPCICHAANDGLPMDPLKRRGLCIEYPGVCADLP